MKTLEYLLTTAAGGFVVFKALNFMLMRTFFQGAQQRMSAIKSHRVLTNNLTLDKAIITHGGKLGATQLRVMYSDKGLIGWHSPLITNRVINSWKLEKVAEAVVTGRLKSGMYESLMFKNCMESLV